MVHHRHETVIESSPEHAVFTFALAIIMQSSIRLYEFFLNKTERTQSMDIPTRQRWLGVLANSEAAALQTLLSPHLPPPEHVEWLRQPQTGLVMVEGRTGGAGARFNLGEVAVTRASCRWQDLTGHGWVRGTDPAHAALIAQADALLQAPDRHPALMAADIEPLADALRARRELASRQAAASKVEFFTMVRGE